MRFKTFSLERWQSLHENRVRYNLSESGVHPLGLTELLDMAGEAGLGDVPLGYGQTNGSDGLREQIASLHPGAAEDSVLVTAGGAEANLTAAWRLVESGRPVAVMMPNYMQIPGAIESLGGQVIPFHLREDDGWQPDLGELEGALQAGAGAVAVTNPNNPTGVCLTPGSMNGIVSLAQRYGAWILSDEVYRGAEIQGPETDSFWGRYDRVLVTNSLSKAYGLPGLRLGWVVTRADVAADLWARKDYTTITVAALSDHLGRVVLRAPVRDRILGRTRAIIRNNLSVLADWMDERSDLFTYRPPDAGAICFPRYHAPIGSTALVEALRTEQDLLVVPGDQFGLDGFLRIGFGLPAEELGEALLRLDRVFRDAGTPS